MRTIFKIRNFLFGFGRRVDRTLREALDMSVPQFGILAAIADSPKGTQAVLAHMRQVTPAAVSKHMNILLSRKLVTRTENRRDRREHAVHLTPKGKTVFTKCMRIFQKHEREVFRHIPKNRLRILDATMTDLLEALETGHTRTI